MVSSQQNALSILRNCNGYAYDMNIANGLENLRTNLVTSSIEKQYVCKSCKRGTKKALWGFFYEENLSPTYLDERHVRDPKRLGTRRYKLFFLFEYLRESCMVLPSRELTIYPIPAGTFGNDFPFPVWWDMLVSWRVF